MKSITVLCKETGISFIAEVKDDKLDEYMTRLQTIVRPECRFIVAKAKFINHVISTHPKQWSPMTDQGNLAIANESIRRCLEDEQGQEG